jgi:hypothetical protein
MCWIYQVQPQQPAGLRGGLQSINQDRTEQMVIDFGQQSGSSKGANITAAAASWAAWWAAGHNKKRKLVTTTVGATDAARL